MTVSNVLGFDPIWYIADNLGLPLAGGYLATFSSLDHSQFKAVYKDPAGMFPWPYVDILNSQGIPIGIQGIQFDENGSQGQFYFQFDSASPGDLYYLEVYDSNGNLVWSVDNYTPGGGSGGGTVTEALNLKNLVINSEMFRNFSNGLSAVSPTTFFVVAPGANTGLVKTSSNAGPDIVFVKNDETATDTLSFTKFTLGEAFPDGTPTPVEYLNYSCTIASSTETQKIVQFPITQGVQNIQDQTTTITIYARGNSGTTTLTLNWLQFFGDGPSAASPSSGPSYLVTPIDTLTLTGAWQKFTVSAPDSNIPSVTGGIVGECNNDGLFLQIQYPLNSTCNIDFTKPCVYLSNLSPDIEYETYDMTDANMDTYRTGDVRTSIQTYINGGWVRMDDGTIGNLSSNAITRGATDTFPLFSMLWDMDSTYVPMYTSAGALQARGASAVDDYAANYAISLPKTLGQVLAGSSIFTITSASQDGPQTFTVNTGTSTSNLVLSGPLKSTAFGTGSPVILQTTGSLPSGLSVNTVYYSIYVNSTTIKVATTIANALAGTGVTFSTNGSGTNTVQLVNNTQGLFQGEISHSQTLAELPQNMSLSIDNAANSKLWAFQGGGSGVGIFLGLSPSPPTTVTATGQIIVSGTNGNAFNVMQPTTFMNVFMKL